jgi:hypothetical protein
MTAEYYRTKGFHSGYLGQSIVASQTAWTEALISVRTLALKPWGTSGRLAQIF